MMHLVHIDSHNDYYNFQLRSQTLETCEVLNPNDYGLSHFLAGGPMQEFKKYKNLGKLRNVILK